MNYDLAKEIRSVYAQEKTTYSELARRYNCGPETIRFIVLERIWKDPKREKMNLVVMDSGHLSIRLSRNMGGKGFLIHRLVLLAFVGPCPDGMEACHYPDQNPANNRLENLRWDTRAGNEKDKIENGTDNRGARHGMSKLTEDRVLEIRRLCKEGVPRREISAKFGISKDYVGEIDRRVAWKHLPEIV